MNTSFVDLAVTPGERGREDTQHGWLELIRPRIVGMSVLDVGTGISQTKARLPECGVVTQEPCPDCPADFHCDISDIPGPYDVVLCLDVIEHVVDYGHFARHLARLATRYLFLTTPGATVTAQYQHVYHFHEFHPWGILNLLEATGLTLVQAWAHKYAPDPATGVLTLASGTEPQTRQNLLSEPFLHPLALLMEKVC